MFNGFIHNIKGLREDVKNYVAAETDFLKLSMADKIVKISTVLLIGALLVVSLWFVAVLLSFALAQFLSDFIPGWAAYLCTAGCFVVFLLLVYFLRRPLIMNPLAKAITRALFRKID